MFDKVVDLKLGKRVPNTMGLSLQDGFKAAQEIIFQEYLNRKQIRGLSYFQHKIDDVWAEQVIEIERLKVQLHNRSVRNAAAPVTYIITDWDDTGSIQMTLRNTRGQETRYSVTYNAGNREILRQQFIAKMEALVKEANERPYQFWAK